MPIQIIAPAPFVTADDEGDDEGGVRLGFDDDGDIAMDGDAPRRAAGRQSGGIVTPGEVVTEDPQWMRGHGTYLSQPLAPGGSQSIVSSLAGTISKTNKLLSIRALKFRYVPEIGDLVVGRILEVQTKRWRVDIAAPHSATLLLSSINLPGGILRKRTSTDELQIRTFFSEGDLLVAEVQTLSNDGLASLHTRSLKYGKLRNGVFMTIDAGMVRRMKSHVLTMNTSNGGGEVDIYLGVNGYIYIAKHTTPLTESGGPEGKSVSITRLEEEASEAIYSNVNEEISPETRAEIARIACVIGALAKNGVKVDDEMVHLGYEAALEEFLQGMEWGGDGGAGKRVVEAALAKRMEG
ncbi:exosome non-catalytic core subunit rrp4 [Orbilia oligospora]|uniref:Exosome non-catalytic core subunit rrp4 n=1 Tax=Orbilia oligospora TaxID=2813651 RepID=A0A7C8J2G9_ORBOL|nr:exosome non-catalytic core subunit rrp4 [Orbilia oligospora]KAF3115809.1 exosome non-catalytic core subunit rrp4 [Orbilia oligospora]KAF3118069.1 exosome non-catalytic core subunit rrp4 [Orbilia oligospora]KAF3134684.1 exosome non-catalytic core subunit rrp4 [Orbilia oligospora]KAF3141521.1 exosome non-catalytic core subunit rrp4 [Orbilia oligospora]